MHWPETAVYGNKKGACYLASSGSIPPNLSFPHRYLRLSMQDGIPWQAVFHRVLVHPKLDLI